MGTEPASGASTDGPGDFSADKTPKKGMKKDASAASGAAKSSDAPAVIPGEKKLTNAELKAKQKAEKAARRAQAKEAKVTVAPLATPASPTAQPGSKTKPKQDGPQSVAGGMPKGQPIRLPATTTPAKEDKPAIPACFSHLPMAKRTAMARADKDVHPAVLALGQHMSTWAIRDSTPRLESTLLAFKQVIKSYETPPGNSFSRHFTPHVLSPQITYLTDCRPMCFSMGNAIRWLKLQISKIDIDMPDEEVKTTLCDAIDNFIRERITLADFIIIRAAAEEIAEGEVVLTFGYHGLVERCLIHALAAGAQFSVVVVDDPYEKSGQEMAKKLAAGGLKITYCPDLSALDADMHGATRIILGAEAVFSNGALYGRVGTSDLAVMAEASGKAVIVLCEMINFTERLAIDSLTYNEVDPGHNSEDGFRLLFDTTPAKCIFSVVTEFGISSPASVPSIIRKLEEL